MEPDPLSWIRMEVGADSVSESALKPMRIHIIAMQHAKIQDMFPPRSQNSVSTQYLAELLQETIFWGPPKVFRLLQSNKYPVLHPDPIICSLSRLWLRL